MKDPEEIKNGKYGPKVEYSSPEMVKKAKTSNLTKSASDQVAWNKLSPYSDDKLKSKCQGCRQKFENE